MTRMLILGPEASLSTLLQEILEQEGYEMIDAANSYEGQPFQHRHCWTSCQNVDP